MWGYGPFFIPFYLEALLFGVSAAPDRRLRFEDIFSVFAPVCIFARRKVCAEGLTDFTRSVWGYGPFFIPLYLEGLLFGVSEAPDGRLRFEAVFFSLCVSQYVFLPEGKAVRRGWLTLLGPCGAMVLFLYLYTWRVYSRCFGAPLFSRKFLFLVDNESSRSTPGKPLGPRNTRVPYDLSRSDLMSKRSSREITR